MKQKIKNTVLLIQKSKRILKYKETKKIVQTSYNCSEFTSVDSLGDLLRCRSRSEPAWTRPPGYKREHTHFLYEIFVGFVLCSQGRREREIKRDEVKN